MCWGNNNFGQLGNSSWDSSTTPVIVNSLSNAVSISAGRGHACSLIDTGGIRCWGGNSQGALGNGTTTDRNSRFPVSNIANATSVTAGAGYTCAVLSDETARCWGENISGKLGDGTTSQRLTPVKVQGLAEVKAIYSGGGNHTCAIIANDELKCWGSNSFGQLGNGSQASSLLPTSAFVVRGRSPDLRLFDNSEYTGKHLMARITATNLAGSASRVTRSLQYLP
jgi:alpha-tubulin suppressor-like RCC1 family protein